MMSQYIGLDSVRTLGMLPVAEHLRPAPRPATMTLCPLFTRLEKPVDRAEWRSYAICESWDIPAALALPIAGEA